ncbi:MAG: Peptidase S9 prolyl oligopeptidase active site domain-containing protein [Candidatus Woesebacteria bacterium GW2011_GWB1_39_12]|uniref:Peptidase S9 prolyl oligopeptidase active site domain-containing protein n=2 Tax=Candidatus Woeseibacteriota TaxID=1752722 RepID=A0A0G0M6C9_9BACT|nr:MAG: Peptidase S9 prolyl oligopeptidase active site domain-containing protein [Candidatus Woesebacteria bacterium GW2011_GWA1_39_12]KKR01898.1 MAG: Peptidase S9 prolyl oligopeptidase active site domain-containing protein [Candidatus Woesebacteria bacterium GW2011_GWB1_39_12]
MKKFLFILILTGASFVVGLYLGDRLQLSNTPSIPIIDKQKPKPFEKYTIGNLAKTEIKPGKLEIKEVLKEETEYSSYLFEFEFNPNLDGKTLKKVTGQINLPKGDGKFPLILMFRGYIDQKLFKTGDGTRNASNFLAERGFITVAPDFLGYGGSDEETANIFETRFQTYVTVLSFLKSIENIPKEPSLISTPYPRLTDSLINRSSIFLWGHSNGGQIALTILEITGGDYPTTLWAPVSKPFPYSVLFYTDESEDRGKLIRRELSKFEEDYDVELYSLANYLDRINAPIQIQQGTVDEAVPLAWSDELVDKFKALDKDIIYNKYPATDHNMRPSWDVVIQRDLEFFNDNLE